MDFYQSVFSEKNFENVCKQSGFKVIILLYLPVLERVMTSKSNIYCLSNGDRQYMQSQLGVSYY